MEHYVSLIHLFGSADGFNTELPEHLHIDYTKDAYRASNKHDYTAQMAMWLCHQEAVDCFTAYLYWCRNSAYPTVAPADECSKVCRDAGSILSSISGADSSLLPLQSQQSENQIKVASTHPTDLSRIPAEKIINGHNASNFLEALTVFLHEHGCPMTPMEFDTFNLYW